MIGTGLTYPIAMSILAIACVLSTFVARATASTLTPAQIEQEIPQSRLAGAGTFHYFGLAIYDARFWVGSQGYRVTVPAAEKFALELCYRRALPGKEIAAASAHQIQKLHAGSIAQHTQWQAKMAQLFPDVKQGSCITGIYLPRQGARFYSHDRLLGDIPDPEFGAAFFAIWLDPRTTDANLRRALLVDAAPINRVGPD